jgi:hypothetical protein
MEVGVAVEPLQNHSATSIAPSNLQEVVRVIMSQMVSKSSRYAMIHLDLMPAVSVEACHGSNWIWTFVLAKKSNRFEKLQ